MRSLDDQSVQSLKHGEAVCLDVLLSSCISFQKGYLKKNELVKIFSLAKSVKMPLNHSFITNVDYLLESLLDATKHRNGSQNFPIPTKIGSYKFLNDIKIEDIRKAIKIYQGNTND
jgi:3-dehydroquinate synthase